MTHRPASSPAGGRVAALVYGTISALYPINAFPNPESLVYIGDNKLHNLIPIALCGSCVGVCTMLAMLVVIEIDKIKTIHLASAPAWKPFLMVLQHFSH